MEISHTNAGGLFKYDINLVPKPGKVSISGNLVFFLYY